MNAPRLRRAVRALGVAATLAGLMTWSDATPGAAGRTIHVSPAEDLQHALDTALPGDTITLEPGGVYRGPFVLPAKGGDDWIVIRSAAPEGIAQPSETRLPMEGTRLQPGDAGALPVLEADRGPVLEAEIGAAHYRLIGLEIRPQAGASLVSLAEFGSGRERSATVVPHDIRLERSYIHGGPDAEARRGVVLNGANLAVIDSYLADFKQRGVDTQAIAGWNGPGPFEIRNNYLEAAGENIMFGGADPPIRDLVPSDIQIRGNLLSKPLTWKPGPRNPNRDAGQWSVKNLLELKSARRVVIDGNVFEHNWPEAQNGFAILFTVRNQDGNAPWSVLEDIAFTNNIVRGATSAINILGRDNNHPSGQARRIRIANNVFEGIGDGEWDGGPNGGRLVQLLEDSADIVVEHNTALQAGNVLTIDGRAHTGFVFRNNIVRHNDYGVVGVGRGVGNDSIAAYLPGATFVRNVFIGGNSSQYPGDNFFIGNPSDVRFRGLDAGDLHLADNSPYRNKATDGSDIGANIDAILAATGGAGPVQPAPTMPLPCAASIRRQGIRPPECLK